jgi:hypothetical protein
VECESQSKKTTFRILLPAYSGPNVENGDDYLEIAEGGRLESTRR